MDTDKTRLESSIASPYETRTMMKTKTKDLFNPANLSSVHSHQTRNTGRILALLTLETEPTLKQFVIAYVLLKSAFIAH